MEKELNCSTFGMEMEIPSQNCYFHPNWDTSMDQNDPFESALSSMVSSPTTTSNGGDGMMIRELIGRLGSICDSTPGNNSTNTSCYSTPLNSPPKQQQLQFNPSNLMSLLMGDLQFPGNYNTTPQQPPNFNADPGFVERAAKYSCFGGGNNANINRSAGTGLENGKLSRVSSNQSMRVSGGSMQIDGNSGVCEKKFSNPEENGDSREGSSVSEQNPGGELGLKAGIDGNSRKRKSIPKAKVKEFSSSTSPALAKEEKVEAEKEQSNAKRSKSNDEECKKGNAEQNAGDSNNKEKQNNNSNNSNKEAPKPEPPKDYIHVRARRGQATDSHSLAERVRREKISERMKFLQDLVPGCNKVTGKATVLDEIINYVQSLQRQVEFLSMKLATVNPRMEFNMEALLSKDMFQSRGSSLPQPMYPLDQSSAQAFPFGFQSSQQLPPSLPNGVPNGTENPFSLNPLNATNIRRNPSLQLPSVDGFGDSMTQLPTFWEDDLQSIVHMGIAQNLTDSVPGSMPNAQMKVEL